MKRRRRLAHLPLSLGKIMLPPTWAAAAAAAAATAVHFVDHVKQPTTIELHRSLTRQRKACQRHWPVERTQFVRNCPMSLLVYFIVTESFWREECNFQKKKKKTINNAKKKEEENVSARRKYAGANIVERFCRDYK
jgi:hypothetical protein